MAKEIKTAGLTPAANCYAVVINAAGQYCTGSAFEAYNSAHWTTYAIALAEVSPGVYMGDAPGACTLTTARYDVVVYQRAGGSAATTDTAVAEGTIGSTFARPSDLTIGPISSTNGNGVFSDDLAIYQYSGLFATLILVDQLGNPVSVQSHTLTLDVFDPVANTVDATFSTTSGALSIGGSAYNTITLSVAYPSGGLIPGRRAYRLRDASNSNRTLADGVAIVHARPSP